MNLTDPFTDDRAVSPVIGVILMAAITVILAAVIGTFVLGLGEKVGQTTPSASFDFEYTDDGVRDALDITHRSGDPLTTARLTVSVSGSTNATVNRAYGAMNLTSAGSTLSLSSDQLNASNVGGHSWPELPLNEATAEVTWASENGDSSAVLGSWEGPDA